MDTLLYDIRFAWRKLRRSPGFAIAALATLALGIGANTAIFSVVDGVLLRPLPVGAPDRTVVLIRDGDTEADVSIPDVRDWRGSLTTLESVALFIPSWNLDLVGTGEPQRLRTAVVEPEFFDVLGIEPIVGRRLLNEDDRRGGDRVAVISAGLWRREFGADPEVVGRTMTLSGNVWTIVGVMPRALDVLELGTDLWVPVAVETPFTLEERGTNNFEAIGRLKPGVELAAARAELRSISEHLADEYPRTNQGKIIVPVPMRDFIVGDVRPALLVLTGAIGLVLLIACVNLANLLLVRATAREGEVALCLALGGGRARVTRPLVAESLLLALAGGALGGVTAVWGTELLVGLAPANLPRVGEVGLDLRVLGFTGGLSVLTGLLFGLVPALFAWRGDPAAAIRAGGGGALAGRGSRRFQNAFVVAEVALSFVLLIGAGLLLRSFTELRSVDPGFRPDGVLTANLVLPEARYSEPERQTRAFRAMVDRIEALPEVEHAAFVIGAPMVGFGAIGHAVRFGDRPPPEPGRESGARNRPVLGDYFRALGIPIVRGRAFRPEDDADAPAVAIVNQRFARSAWPDEDPIGKRVAWRMGDSFHWMTVVGVAADVKTLGLAGQDQPAIYTSYRQRTEDWQRFGTLVVRGATDDAAGVASAVRRVVREVDPALPLTGVATMDERIGDSLARERFSSTTLGIFAVVALAIAVQGLYGVLAYIVARRRREIGIRMALGAGAARVRRLVLLHGGRLAAVGLAIGAVVALGASRLLSGLLFGVAPIDPTTYALVAVTLAVTALAAAWVPAHRATRVDPTEALRED